jgi:hypothetical protein
MKRETTSTGCLHCRLWKSSLDIEEKEDRAVC